MPSSKSALVNGEALARLIVRGIRVRFRIGSSLYSFQLFVYHGYRVMTMAATVHKITKLLASLHSFSQPFFLAIRVYCERGPKASQVLSIQIE